VPLLTTGSKRDCLFAFARRLQGRVTITCVPRLVASLLADRPMPPIGADVWRETAIEHQAIGTEKPPACYRNVLTGETVTPVESDGRLVLPAAKVFERFPIALLTS
jgi:maltooligosyltrehalose synthase